jgi:hypothetical protein
MRSKMKITRRRFFPLDGGVLAAAAVPAPDVGSQRISRRHSALHGECQPHERPRRYSQEDGRDRLLRSRDSGVGKTFRRTIRDLLRDAGLRAPSAHFGAALPG